MFLWDPSTSQKPTARMTGHLQLINQVRTFRREMDQLRVCQRVQPTSLKASGQHHSLGRVNQTAASCSSHSPRPALVGMQLMSAQILWSEGVQCHPVGHPAGA